MNPLRIVLRKINGRFEGCFAARGTTFAVGREINAASFFSFAAAALLVPLAIMAAIAAIVAMFAPSLAPHMFAVAHHTHGLTALPFAIGAQELLPFRAGTRQRNYKFGLIPYATGTLGTPLNLPQIGMLSRIIAQLRGTVTYSAPGALSDQGPWNIISRLQLLTNIGAANVYDVSGYGAFTIMRTLQSGWSPELAGFGASLTPNADVHVWPLSGTAQAFTLTYEVPVGINDGGNFETGLLNAQAPETRITLQASFGQLTDPATLVTATTGNLHCYEEFYEIGDLNQFALPPLALVRWLEEQQSITGTGDSVYTVPRMGAVANVIHVVTLNGARSDSIDACGIKFNKTDAVYTNERQWMRVEERRSYSVLPTVGVYYWDFFNAYGGVNRGDTRDTIDSEQLTTLESIVTVSSGASLGGNNNFLKTVRRIFQVLQ